MSGLTVPPSRLIQALVHECILNHGEDSTEYKTMKANIDNLYFPPFRNDVVNKVDERA